MNFEAQFDETQPTLYKDGIGGFAKRVSIIL